MSSYWLLVKFGVSTSVIQIFTTTRDFIYGQIWRWWPFCVAAAYSKPWSVCAQGLYNYMRIYEDYAKCTRLYQIQ